MIPINHHPITVAPDHVVDILSRRAIGVLSENKQDELYFIFNSIEIVKFHAQATLGSARETTIFFANISR